MFMFMYKGTACTRLVLPGCVGAVLGPVELVICILVEWERRLIFNIFNILISNIHLRGQPSKQ